MLKHQISTYYNTINQIYRFGGSLNETALRTAFVPLINHYAERRNLLLVTEIGVAGKKGKPVYPDGVLKNSLRLEFGCWEAKDTKDNFDYEIKKKLYDDGYPDRNILFEDTKEAVLYQEGQLIQRVSMEIPEALDEILSNFTTYEPVQVKLFNEALNQFKQDVPTIVLELRKLTEIEADTNKLFRQKRDEFLEMAKSEINPSINAEDVREMIIQHILTEDIFNSVFGNVSFHRFNNVARTLEDVVNSFMTYQVRQSHLSGIQHYYSTLSQTALSIADNQEKQKFLKTVYENFYKVYNPKGADKLGVVYTPNEIVRFMIDSTDWLLNKHFNKTLSDKGVDILDPATGTGTFIAELIERINIKDLDYKYENELHANEVAILPYYIANLNIEYTYQQRMNDYKEFRSICFVDTLDNTSALDYSGKQDMLFGISSENAKRIKDQNAKKISVIIGNPPYNAKQPNYNFQNANRSYKEIDKRIKDTYIKHGTAQNQIVVYDMFTRFYRWSMDRLNDKGVIAFITNRSFIDSRAFDGFRKSVQNEFDAIYIVDLRSDVRANPKIAGTSHNVFGIQTGVAMAFLVKDSEKKKDKRQCKIHYVELDDFWRKEKKLEWIRENPISQIEFNPIEPDTKNNWINQTDNDWDSLMPLIDKDKKNKQKQSIFDLSALGVLTNRDEWVYDFDINQLESKAKFLEKVFNQSVKNKEIDFSIKWSSSLEAYFKAKLKAKYNLNHILKTLYRPYTKMFHYTDKLFNHRLTQNHYDFFSKRLNANNKLISFSGVGANKEFHLLASDTLAGGDTLEKTQCVSLYTFDSENQKHENITAWALNQFQTHYIQSKGKQITKQDIFYYVYAVLHSPVYRKKYEQNLKREFPRIPFYDDFFQWRDWGKELMDLHINYETQKPYPLKRVDADLSFKKKDKPDGLFAETVETSDEAFTVKPRTKLRADKTQGVIEVDSQTTLTGVPPSAWEYKLGNRSAIEWILDQYKERKPKDATIAERFNTYKFEDYKDQVIDLIKRVTTVSVETMEIINSMPDDS